MYIHLYIRTYVHTFIHTYICTYIYTYVHMYIHLYIRTYVHTFIHTYIHLYIRTYVHTFIHTYVRTYKHPLTYWPHPPYVIQLFLSHPQEEQRDWLVVSPHHSPLSATQEKMAHMYARTHVHIWTESHTHCTEHGPRERATQHKTLQSTKMYHPL